VEVAQILLTHDGIADRDMYLNARAAIDALLAHRVVPIINENDTIAVDEIRFGDNDQLAAMVAALTGADLLVLLTDVQGLLDDDGNRIALVRDVEEVKSLVRPHMSGGLSLGGMESKLEAARRAALRGLPVVIADARDGTVLEQVMAGADVGTLVMPKGSPLASRKHWIAYTLKPRGTILVDAGAAHAMCTRQSSLLPIGVIGVRGDFAQGDAVSVVGPDGAELGRGLTRYAMPDVARLAGARAADIEARLGHYAGDAVVHRDDLVVL
jgi:glutamate 5-kinase